MDPNTSSVWEACWDENSDQFYYWNVITGETTWDHPGTDQPSEDSNRELQRTNAIHTDDGVSPTSHSAYITDDITHPERVVISRYDCTESEDCASTSFVAEHEPSHSKHKKISTPYHGDQYGHPYVDVKNNSIQDTYTQDAKYIAVGTFNARTGRFQAPGSTASVLDFTPQERAFRQMGHYFDYDAWNDQQNMAHTSDTSAMGTSRKSKGKLSRKDIEKLKARRAEAKRKKQRWLFD